MRSPKFICMLAALAFAFAVGSTQAASIKLPPGTNWHTATPDQISEAVFNAVQKNPDKATEIVAEAIEQIAKTGRFSRRGIQDGKQVIEPGGVMGFEDMAEQIGQAATRANPAQSAQIAQAVSNAIANTAGILPEGGGGGGGEGGVGGGWGGDGGAPPPLPGGWGGGGGGGGGTGGGTIYSN